MDNRFDIHLGNEKYKDKVEHFNEKKVQIEQCRKQIDIKNIEFKWKEEQVKELKKGITNENSFVCVYDIFKDKLIIDYIKNVDNEIGISYILITGNTNPGIPENIFNIYKESFNEYYFIFGKE